MVRWVKISSVAVLAQSLFVSQSPISASSVPAQIELHPAFTIEVVDTPGISRPTSVAFPPESSNFGPGMYVSSAVHPDSRKDFIYRISPEGDIKQFATLPGESSPVDIEFAPPSSEFGDFLYVSANNRDGGRWGDQGGTILRVDSQGNVTDFTPVGLQPEGKPWVWVSRWVWSLGRMELS